MKTKTFKWLPIILGALLAACQPGPVEENDNLIPVNGGSFRGVYMLNEGGWQQNNASLDYLNFSTKTYQLSYFTKINPSVVQGLGDVGNDIIIYGSKAYICVNGSGLIEVIDAYTAKHLAQIALSNCRRLCAYDGQVYATSYAGRVVDTDHQLGLVAQIDTVSLTITATCEVGYQPEGMAVADGKLYVANSGGYVGMNTGTYDNRISVISLNTFTLDKHLMLALNPQEILVDSRNQLWISTYGNYADVPAMLYCLDPQTEIFTEQNLPVTKMAMVEDTIYLYATTYDASWHTTTDFYWLATVTGNRSLLNIPAQTSPNGIALHPQTKEVYITDADDYASPGTLSCYTRMGQLLWKVRTGVAPGRLAFVP